MLLMRYFSHCSIAMEPEKNYIKYLRDIVGNAPIILNFAGCCVINDAGEVLLQKRGEGKDSWGFPGGALELGESIREAAIREVFEETGLQVELGELIGTYSKYMCVYPNGHRAQTILTVFQARPLGGTLSADGEETLELRYFPLDQTPTLFNEQHMQILSDLRAGRKNQVD